MAEKDHYYTSAIVIAQLAYWVRTKDGRQRTMLQTWLTRLTDSMQGRIFGFNGLVAHVWTEQEHLFEKSGIKILIEDGYIAATAETFLRIASRSVPSGMMKRHLPLLRDSHTSPTARFSPESSLPDSWLGARRNAGTDEKRNRRPYGQWASRRFPPAMVGISYEKPGG